jgi:Tol biopolymer transport system component
MPTKDMPTNVLYSDINIVSIDGSNHRIISEKGSYSPNLLPTRNGIIYENGNFSLYIINYDGSNQSRLYPNIPWGDRYFSSDESKILLASELFENNQYLNNLYLMNSDGSNLLQLAPQKGQYGYPHISPNLDEIVFCLDSGIATINVDGTNLQYIRTKIDSTDCIYNLYVDENHILYFEHTNSITTIRLFDKTNRQDKLVGNLSAGLPGYGRALVGGKLLFADLGMIKVLDIYTSSISNLTQGFYASYSFDGTKIVYSDGHSICTMNGNGSSQQTIYIEQDSTKSIEYPQFSADDKLIIFPTSYTVITH